MLKPGSKYTESYYSRFGRDKTSVKPQTTASTNEQELRRIIENYRKGEYEKLRAEHAKRMKEGIPRFVIPLYTNGTGSTYVVFERDVGWIKYGDGREKKFIIPLT